MAFFHAQQPRVPVLSSAAAGDVADRLYAEKQQQVMPNLRQRCMCSCKRHK
jgi:hypothetical protein